MGAWLAFGPGADLEAAVNNVLQQDQDIMPPISGLVNLCAYSFAMVAQLIGSTSESVLGGFIARDE